MRLRPWSIAVRAARHVCVCVCVCARYRLATQDVDVYIYRERKTRVDELAPDTPAEDDTIGGKGPGLDDIDALSRTLLQVCVSRAVTAQKRWLPLRAPSASVCVCVCVSGAAAWATHMIRSLPPSHT